MLFATRFLTKTLEASADFDWSPEFDQRLASGHLVRSYVYLLLDETQTGDERQVY